MSAPLIPQRRQLLQGAGCFLLTLTAPMLAHGASIVAVRLWPAPDYTRITLESDKPLAARHFMTSAPDRLVIDIEGLELSATLRDIVAKVRPDDPYLAGVRVGQNQPRVVRLVLDLKQKTLPQVFTLQPVAAYRHRMVFDLHPAAEPDPLLALLQDPNHAAPLAPAPQTASAPAQIQADTSAPSPASQAAADSIQDALGDFIAGMDQPPPQPVLPAPTRQAQVTPRKPASRPARTPAREPDPGSRSDRLFIVALDPGHGGEDPGAIGPTGLKEKDVVLAVARRLRDRINAQPNMRAMMTRDADFFVPLNQRVEKARRVQADLFISIHADAFIRPEARGASVFVLSGRGASSTTARWLANKENAADIVGGVNARTQDAHVLQALLDMSTTAQINDSLRLGSEMLQHIGRVGRLHKQRVEQAGFAVLKAPDIPSVLVETAFISNPQEEALLRNVRFQRNLVDALFTGVQRYFEKAPSLARRQT